MKFYAISVVDENEEIFYGFRATRREACNDLRRYIMNNTDKFGDEKDPEKIFDSICANLQMCGTIQYNYVEWPEIQKILRDSQKSYEASFAPQTLHKRIFKFVELEDVDLYYKDRAISKLGIKPETLENYYQRKREW